MTHEAASQKSRATEVATAGKTFPDGTMLEPLRDPSNMKQVRLLCWRNGTSKIGESVEHEGTTYVPADLESGIPSLLLLPTHVAAEESPRELFSAIQNLLADRLEGQCESFVTIMTFMIFVSWMADALPMVPILWVNISPTSPKFPTLGLLRALCRRPIVFAGVRRADFPCLAWHVNSTLLLDEPDMHPAVQRLLSSSSRRNVLTVNGRRVLNLCGPKIIFSRELPYEALCHGDALKISLMPARSRPVVSDESTEQQIAEKFQPRLLGFRLRHLKVGTATKLESSYLTSPGQELAHALGAAVAGDEALTQLILPLLSAQDEELRTDRSSTIESVVIEALLAFCHEDGSRDIRAMELAQRVNAIYGGRGSEMRISAEKAGWVLKKLSVPTGRIGSAGNGVRLTHAVVRFVHELAMAHEVPTLQNGSLPRCDFCDKLKGRSVS